MPLALEVLLVNKEKEKKKKRKKDERIVFILYFSLIFIINHFLKGVKVSHFSPQSQGSRSFQSHILKGTGGFKTHLKCSLLIRGSSHGFVQMRCSLQRSLQLFLLDCVRVWAKTAQLCAGWKSQTLFAHQYPEGGDKCLLIRSPRLWVSCHLAIYLKVFRRGSCSREVGRSQGHHCCPSPKGSVIWGTQSWLWLL